jgi:hypothetical protein
MSSSTRRPEIPTRRVWMTLARAACLLYIAGATIELIAVLPLYLADYEHPCLDTPTQSCALRPSQVQALAAIGVPVDVYAWVAVSLRALILLVSLILALILIWRRGDDPMALLVAAFLVSQALVTQAGSDSSAPIPDYIVPPWVSAVLVIISFTLYVGVFLLFPSGRFVPRWVWVFLLGALAFAIEFTIFPGPLGWLTLGYPVLFGAGIASQVYRYRRVSTTIEQQQTKLAVVALVLSLVANILFWVPETFIDVVANNLYMPAMYLVWQLAKLFVPIMFFIAIQRYGLYEIDRIINKALVYGALSAILALVFLVTVIGLQTLVRTMTGQKSPVTLVVSTLLIAALFQPLRSRIQKIIDRGFYRAKYDARKAAESFSATVRQEVSLTGLQANLLSVVEQTMRPTRLSLWLAPRPMEQLDTPDAATPSSHGESPR